MLSNPALAATITRQPLFLDDLVQEIDLALKRTGYPELFDIDVIVDGRDVLLRGRVPCYFMKQKAEFVTRSIPTVATLKSDIEVCRA